MLLKFYMNMCEKSSLAKSCGILQESCRKFVQDSCKIPQDLAGMQEKMTFSCKILQERFYWVW